MAFRLTRGAGGPKLLDQVARPVQMQAKSSMLLATQRKETPCATLPWGRSLATCVGTRSGLQVQRRAV